MTAEYQDRAHLPAGMSHFARWFQGIPGRPKVQPADGDAILHSTRRGNRFLLFEFKPVGAPLTTGQSILLSGFGRKPGCQAMLVFDPHAHDRSGAAYAEDEEVALRVFSRGFEADVVTTFRGLNRVLAAWYARDIDLVKVAERTAAQVENPTSPVAGVGE
ncbi:MAG: hypothetical protein B7X41_16765 [Microbacterium sp. 14-71-5]|uniref:hypothetical protein n=1 Tax=Microbacterium sp. 13-71-7 TaxID=1970399 RepID=UPI000BCB52D4|nr:hypothetical protein [Microbacterium sp. 13-71-7]OZB80561.1 MAG: hypothetical protein B7X32_19135 [Microbacterium sp. 13-71-7]OZB81569.1 MAG: hypothetical protein B7X41_16765 [Microbacterium sp. 14-71-5]